MTLSEAARTGRKFRRTSVPYRWYWLEGKQMLSRADQDEAGTEGAQIDAEMLVASDWEAEPLKLEVTAADVIRAARQLDDLASKRRLSAAEFGKMICVNLGLLEEDTHACV